MLRPFSKEKFILLAIDNPLRLGVIENSRVLKNLQIAP